MEPEVFIWVIANCLNYRLDYLFYITTKNVLKLSGVTLFHNVIVYSIRKVIYGFLSTYVCTVSFDFLHNTERGRKRHRQSDIVLFLLSR